MCTVQTLCEVLIVLVLYFSLHTLFEITVHVAKEPVVVK